MSISKGLKECIAEDELYPRNAQGTMVKGVRLNFSDLEARLPTLFVILYALSGVVLTGNLIYNFLK